MKTKNVVGQIVEKLGAVYKPDKIYVFGSVASGRVNADSDVDVLVIKSDVPRRGIDRLREVRRIVGLRQPIDYLVYTPQEFEQWFRAGDPFITQVVETGNLVYG